MVKKIVLGVAAVALVIGLMPSASASCIPAKNASTYANGIAAYWHPATVVGGNDAGLVGQSWQLGNPNAWNSNGGAVNCNTFQFLYFSAGGINLNLDLGACGAGCPATGSTIAVLAQLRGNDAGGHSVTDFLMATVTETLTGNTFFDYAQQGDHNMIQLSRPRVTNSSRSGTNVNLSLNLPAITGGLYGPNAASAVTGYVVRSVSSPTNPGRNAASYTSTLGTFAATGGTATTAAVTVDCSNIANDQWVVTQLNFEGGAIGSPAVSEATQVKCNPALADPKFKIVPKKHDNSLNQ